MPQNNLTRPVSQRLRNRSSFFSPCGFFRIEAHAWGLHRHLAQQNRVSSDELASDVQSAAKYAHPPLKKLPSDRDRRPTMQGFQPLSNTLDTQLLDITPTSPRRIGTASRIRHHVSGSAECVRRRRWYVSLLRWLGSYPED